MKTSFSLIVALATFSGVAQNQNVTPPAEPVPPPATLPPNDAAVSPPAVPAPAAVPARPLHRNKRNEIKLGDHPSVMAQVGAQNGQVASGAKAGGGGGGGGGGL